MGGLDTEIREEGGKGGVNHHCAGPRDMRTLRAWVERRTPGLKESK